MISLIQANKSKEKKKTQKHMCKSREMKRIMGNPTNWQRGGHMDRVRKTQVTLMRTVSVK